MRCPINAPEGNAKAMAMHYSKDGLANCLPDTTSYTKMTGVIEVYESDDAQKEKE